MLFLALVAFAAAIVDAASFRSAASCTSPCLWTSTSSWVPTGSPTNGDNVVLSSGTTISLTSNTFAVNITFESASTLQLSSSGVLASGSTIWGHGTIFIGSGGVWQAPTSQAGAAGIDLVIDSIDTNFRLDYTAGSVSKLTINSLQVNTNTLFEVAQISGGSNLTVNGNVTFLALPIAMLAKPSSGGSAPFVMNVFGATRANQQSNSQTILTDTANIIYNSYGWFGPNLQGEGTSVIITSAFRLISGPFAWRCSSGCTFRGPAYVGSGVTFPQLLGSVTVESSSLNSFSGSLFAATAFTQTGGAFGGFVSGASGSSVITFSGVTASADVTLGTGTLTGSLTNTGRKLTLSGTSIASGTTITGGSLAGSLTILSPLAINTFISN